jgi:hypothetical protein
MLGGASEQRFAAFDPTCRFETVAQEMASRCFIRRVLHSASRLQQLSVSRRFAQPGTTATGRRGQCGGKVLQRSATLLQPGGRRARREDEERRKWHRQQKQARQREASLKTHRSTLQHSATNCNVVHRMLAAGALSAQPFAKALAVSAAAPMGFSALDRWPNGRCRSCAKCVQDMHAQRLAEDIRADQLRREEVRCPLSLVLKPVGPSRPSLPRPAGCKRTKAPAVGHTLPWDIPCREHAAVGHTLPWNTLPWDCCRGTR